MINKQEYDGWLDEIAHCQQMGLLYNSKDDMDEIDYCTKDTFCPEHASAYEQIYKYYPDALYATKEANSS